MIAYPAEVGGILTRNLEAGRGPAIILIHGLCSRADRWCRNVDVLAAAGYRVIACDLPGHGFAEKGPRFDYSATGYAYFVINLLEAMNLGYAVLVGTSFGGLVAGTAALLAPGRVSGLVMAGSLGLCAMGRERRQVTIENLADMRKEALQQRLQNAVADPSVFHPSDFDEEYMINNSPGAKESFSELAKYYEHEIDDDVLTMQLKERSDLPLLLIWGELDPAVPIEIGRAADKEIGRACLIEFDNVGHLPYLERSEVFNSVVVRFMQTLTT